MIKLTKFKYSLAVFFLFFNLTLTFCSTESILDLSYSSLSLNNSTDIHKPYQQKKQENKHIYYGFWDHKSGFDFINIGKSMSKSIEFIVEEGIPGIAIIEGFSEDRNQIRERLKDNSSFIIKYSPDTENLFTILTDEPYSEGKNAHIMEQMINDAKEIIGQEYEFAFTFKELAFRDERKFPKNLDWVGINFYPFRAKNGVQNRQQFMNRFKYIYERAKEKAPNAKIFVVGQAFKGGKWVHPPVEAPFWYMEFVQENDIDALLWWKLRSSSSWNGAVDMPRLMSSIREVGYQLIELN